MFYPNSIKAQCLACVAVNMGSVFVGGTVIGWSITVIPKLTDENSSDLLTGDQVGWVISIVGLGAIIGPILTWLLIDRIGRKATILLSVTPLTISYVIMAVGKDYQYLLAGRALAGIGMGIMLSAVPLYIGEITEDNIRGAMGVVAGVTNNCGILFSIIIGSYVNVRRLNMICALMACMLASLLMMIPESPYFYLMKGKTEMAKKSLSQLRKTNEINSELKIMTEYVERKKIQISSTFDLITKRGNRRAFVILVILMATQLYSGSLAIPTYAYGIFNDSGYDISLDNLVTIMAVATLIASFIGIFLIDHLGRRPVLFFGSIVMLICLIANGIFYTLKDQEYDVSNFTLLPIVTIIGYTTSVSCGIHNLPIIVLSEYFSTTVKAKAAMIFSIIMAILSSSSIKLFQISYDDLGLGASFFICSVALIIGTTILYFIMPETKGYSLQSIENMHSGQSCETIATVITVISK